MKFKTCLITLLSSAAFFCVTGCVVVRERPHEVVATEAPPTPQAEVVPVSPGPQYVWAEGYWVWRSRWVWEPGRWMVRPHIRAVWVSGHWDRRRRGWVWAPGHWR